ncbi:hypothetical protein AB0B63_08405 [Micromonospora sp. NPDC049081]|uniref:hypothetical protein n=1 Tax=Micromonospora sp. NPDC049081 TaxID=3155150 RepID=UPI0033F9F37E
MRRPTPNPPSPGTATLTRYFWPGRDHVSSATYPGGSYQAEGSLGKVLTAQVAGSHPLYQCQINNDRFTSVSANCEGRTFLGVIGYAYDGPPAAAHLLLYRCITSNGVDHFDSPDPNCEGQNSEGTQGYLLL